MCCEGWPFFGMNTLHCSIPPAFAHAHVAFCKVSAKLSHGNEALNNNHRAGFGTALLCQEATSESVDRLEQAKEKPSWVNRQSTIPLYHQLFLKLRDRLISGEWKPGEIFPRDADIVAHYAVSRITVRKAMDGLVNEGLVVRFRGKGTFVAHIAATKTKIASDNRPSYFKTIPGKYRREVQKVAKVVISKHTADKLNVPDNHLASILKMVHWIDEIPICSEAIFVDDFKWPNLFETKDIETRDIREIYRQNGMVVTKIQQSVSAIIPAPETAQRLALAPNQPVLFISRVGYAENGSPLDFRLIHCRGDRFVLAQDISSQ